MNIPTITNSSIWIHGFYSKELCGYCKNGSSSSFGATCPIGHFLNTENYESLMLVGWRRSGRFFYKPQMSFTCCPQYTIRLAVNNFKISKNQKKIINKLDKYCKDNNLTLDIKTSTAVYSDEIFELYKKYQNKVYIYI